MDNVIIGRAIIKVYRADGLAAADLNGKSDPFAVVRLVNQVYKTATQYRTLNPEWNETFDNVLVNDIHECIDIHVYDEDRHGVDFLGRICVPLLKVHSGRRFWYQLKDKNLKRNAKGRILLQITLTLDEHWLVKACWRTFNPRQQCLEPPKSTLKKSLLVTHFNRLKAQATQLMAVARYIQSCFEWTSKQRSCLAFALFLVVTYFFELWMLPASLLLLFAFNYACIESPPLRSRLGLSELVILDEMSHQKYIMTSIAALDSQDEPFELLSDVTGDHPTSNVGGGSSGFTFNCVSTIFSNKHKTTTTTSSTVAEFYNDTNNNNNDAADNKNIFKRIQAVPDVIILVQDILGNIASYGERIVNTFTFKVRFLSYLMMFCCAVATVLLYFVPLRIIVFAWGINKFTKKLRNPHAIDNNELVDFLSRVPDDIQILKYHNEIIEVPVEAAQSPAHKKQHQQQMHSKGE